MGLIGPVLIALICIAIGSSLREPMRQKLSAVIIAGAGGAYFSSGFGPWEIVFSVILLLLAYLGLRDYRAIGIAWLLHTGWDFAHELYGDPIIPWVPSSSFGCMICDPVLALWYFAGAPSIWKIFSRFGKSDAVAQGSSSW